MRNISSKFPINSEANASEFIENIEEMFPVSYQHRNDYLSILSLFLTSFKDKALYKCYMLLLLIIVGQGSINT